MGGAYYLKSGASIALQKGNRLFVVLPMIINFVLLAASLYFGIDYLSTKLGLISNWLPSWLEWLSFIIKPLFIISLIIVFVMTFSVVANFIASPFYGFLSQQVANKLRPDLCEEAGSMNEFLKSIPKALIREVEKFNYYLPRALGLWLIGLIIPGVNFLLWFAFNAWMMSLQYLDYPIDNQGKKFKEVRILAGKNKRFAYVFGGLVQFASLIPLINLIVMPAAVCGATQYWCETQPQKSPQ